MVEPSLSCHQFVRSPLTITPYTERQNAVIQALGLTFASVSVVSTSLTVYWFLTMRRAFRHDLIMILIQSDMFKALLYMIHAIAAFILGAVDSASMLCQIIGFFHTVGLELADFAVFIIVIHHAVYVFRPPISVGEGGIYPYRYTAYILLVTLPFLMATLAFINPVRAYESGGAVCHLPVRPFGYQLALSWFPRYLIFLGVLGIDISIYFYLRYKFGDFGESISASEQISKTQKSIQNRRGRNGPCRNDRVYSLLPTPPLAYHGLIPGTRRPSMVPLKVSRPATENKPTKFSRKPPSSFFWIKWIKTIPLTDGADSSTDINTQGTTIITSKFELRPLPISDVEISSRASSMHAARLNPRSPSNVSILSFLLASQPRISSSIHAAEISNLEGQSYKQDSLPQTRRKIKQQLRFLFIYPLAYMAMWIIPFTSHILDYNDYYIENPPFLLSAFVTIFSASQSSVDCWIFNMKEKPWRQSSQNQRSAERQSYLESLRPELQMRSFWRNAGRGKSTINNEARFAYERRAQEIEDRESQLHNAERSERSERSWWDEIEDTIEM